MKSHYSIILALLAGTSLASAITVKTPANGAELTSPFNLVASTGSCDSKPAASMGYSLDYGKTTIVKTSFSSMVLAGEGRHVLHVKCWGSHGAKDVEDVDITIVPTNVTEPSNMTVVSNIQSFDNWVWSHDPGTPGRSAGSSDIAPAPSLSGNARRYSVSFSNSGGEIYHTSFGKDTKATHFIYDAQIWLDDPSSLGNIEMDMNQVISNGDTVIYGVQCDGYSGTWDYTLNTGTQAHPRDTWIHSNVACPAPRTWEPNTWHHIEISYSRDGAGNVTYESIALDGQHSEFVGASGNSAFRLGWGATLLTNFQLDGLGSGGSITAYLDRVSISRW